MCDVKDTEGQSSLKASYGHEILQKHVHVVILL